MTQTDKEKLDKVLERLNQNVIAVDSQILMGWVLITFVVEKENLMIILLEGIDCMVC